MTSASHAWAVHYDAETGARGLWPESFVVRMFNAKAPVSFLDDKAYAGKRALDLGCGHGRHIPFLQSLGFEVVGLEISESLVARLQERFAGAEFVEGRNGAIPLPDASVDVILSANAIYYLDDPSTPFSDVMAEVARVLKPGGALATSFVGAKHWIMRDAERRGEAAIIASDALSFRNGAALRPVWDGESLSDLVAPLRLKQAAEVTDAAAGLVRHLHYGTALKAG